MVVFRHKLFSKTTMYGLKQRTKKVNFKYESVSIAPPTATKKRTLKITADNSYFAKSLLSVTTQPKKDNSACKNPSDGSQRTLEDYHGTPTVQTKTKSQKKVLQGSIFNQQDTKRSLQSFVTSNSGSLKKTGSTVVRVNSSQSPANGAIIKEPNSTTTPVSSTKEDSVHPRSSATADSVSAATATSAMSAHTGFGDPYTWACMFGAMTAEMNFFSNQVPRWPGAHGVQSEATPTVGDQLAAPQPQRPPFGPGYPGFTFPWPRWQAP
jgi:hypothetical protein